MALRPELSLQFAFVHHLVISNYTLLIRSFYITKEKISRHTVIRNIMQGFCNPNGLNRPTSYLSIELCSNISVTF